MVNELRSAGMWKELECELNEAGYEHCVKVLQDMLGSVKP
jgi:hypothetical protein